MQISSGTYLQQRSVVRSPSLLLLFCALGCFPAFAQLNQPYIPAQAVKRFPELGKNSSPAAQEFFRRMKIYSAENPQFIQTADWAEKLADEVAKEIGSYAPKPTIEFKVLLIIKRYSDTYHPLFLPIRSEMTEEEIATARHCFEIQTPDMVHDITRGKVKFTPTVFVSNQPMRALQPSRKDSAEYMAEEMGNELATIARPGDYDSVGYYFLYYDRASGYRIPRAGYGVGGFNGSLGVGAFAVGSPSKMNPRDEIFLHEWMHGLEGYYGNKSGVRLAKGGLHGGTNYDAHYNQPKPWRPQDSFKGYMEWYKDLLNCKVPDGSGFVGLGDEAWKLGPMRDAVKMKENKKDKKYPVSQLPKGAYPQWIHELMKGNVKNAHLGATLLPGGMQGGEITKNGQPWQLENWSAGAGTNARFSPSEGGVFTLHCPKGDHASICADVSLRPFRNYVLTAEVKADGIQLEQPGGKYSVLISAGGSQSTRTFSGTSDWVSIVLPFTTRPDQSESVVRLQIGGGSSLTSGTASFRNVKLQKIDYPEGAISD